MASILRQLNGLPYKKGKAAAYPSNTATINILIVICLIPEHFRILNPCKHFFHFSHPAHPACRKK